MELSEEVLGFIEKCNNPIYVEVIAAFFAGNSEAVILNYYSQGYTDEMLDEIRSMGFKATVTASGNGIDVTVRP